MEIPVNNDDEIEMEIPVNEDDEIEMEIPHEDIGEKVPFQRVLKRAMEIKYLIDEIREEATIWDDEESTYEFVREIKDAMENSKADFHLLEKKESGSKIGFVVSKESKKTPEKTLTMILKKKVAVKLVLRYQKNRRKLRKKTLMTLLKMLKKVKPKEKRRMRSLKWRLENEEKRSPILRSPHMFLVIIE